MPRHCDESARADGGCVCASTMIERLSMPNSLVAPHRVLIAPDKFKGTLSAKEAASAIQRGLQSAWSDAHFTCVALADGGEGFTQCLVEAKGGQLHSMRTLDALGRSCTAHWGELDRTSAAFDISSASGLSALTISERNPLQTSTFGSGLVLRELMSRGYAHIFVGLGGSATTDAGIGIAAALGFRFVDGQGKDVELNGQGLASIVRIESPRSIARASIVIATDVTNPLYGADGAAHQFARQKGADEEAIAALDGGLQHFAAIVAEYVGEDYSAYPGAGAAGGVGFGMLALLGAEQRSGFDVLSDRLKLPALIEAHDLIITGEGAFDRTSLAGKAPMKLAELAHRCGRQIWGVFGRCEIGEVHDYFDRHVTLESATLPNSPQEHMDVLSRRAFELATRE
jgi:glycerate 2-kinase